MKPHWPYEVIALATIVAGVQAFADSAAVDYNRDVRPVLADNCFQCHGPDARARKADLRLDDPAIARRVLDAPAGGVSEFIKRLTADDPGVRMPPAESPKVLSGDDRALLQRWAEAGGEYQEHWAFISPKRPDVPAVEDGGWVRNPIDAFIYARANEAGLDPSPEADRYTLIRRLTLDLTGLPPTPEEVEAFVWDPSSGAYEKLADRLFASKRYGEHMAWNWMEVSRYADTDGYQNDRLRYMFVWRDWVIQSFNENLPYDLFVIEQMAGDMLPDATLRQQIATGFNRNHRINSENGSIPEEWLVEYVVDRVDTLGTAFLGLTLNCARCHDHKYDPISQKEYYSLFAQFNNVPEWGVGPNNGNSPPFIQVPESWPWLGDDEDRKIAPDPYELTDPKNGVRRPQPGDDTTVMVMHEGDPRPAYVLNRGVYDDPDTSEEIAPGVPDIISRFTDETPRDRLELAYWLVDPDHPLTSRVVVNRYWQHFFGRGIVESSDNFGIQGAFPSHPELLDWLATEFIRMDWDVKAFQKMIVMSAAYRQQSIATDEARAVDPGNRYWARAPRLRLTAAQLRDQALYASGLLVERIGGRSVKPYMPPGVWASLSNARYDQGHGDSLYRRSLYTYWRRTTPPPMMTGFNAPDRDACMVRASLTNSPLHALTLMNNIVFVEAARFLAERMMGAGESARKQIAFGFQQLAAREPTSKELDALHDAFGAFYEDFQAKPEAAVELLIVGEKPAAAKYDPVYLASMALTASAIMNLDEVIVRN